MGNAYPVSYRQQPRAARGGGGFQGRRPVYEPRSRPGPPKPANDNIKPANDNDPIQRPQKDRRALRRSRSFRRVSRQLRKAIKPLKYLDTLGELIDWAVEPSAGHGAGVPNFTPTLHCGGPPPNWQSIGSPTGSCQTLQAGGFPLGTPIPASWSAFWTAWGYPVLGTGWRWNTTTRWVRISPGASQWGSYAPALEPSYLPWFDPHFTPMDDRPYQPKAPPYRIWNAPPLEVPPFPQWRHGGQPAGRLKRPQSIPDTVFGPSGKPSHRPATHRNAPPGRGRKEQKTEVWSLGPGAIQKALSVITEAKDAVEAVWKALPRQYRTRNARPDQMLRDLYRHWDKVNAAQAVANLILEQIEDRLYGRIGKTAAQASRSRGRSIGIQAELSATRRAAMRR